MSIIKNIHLNTNKLKSPCHILWYIFKKFPITPYHIDNYILCVYYCFLAYLNFFFPLFMIYSWLSKSMIEMGIVNTKFKKLI